MTDEAQSNHQVSHNNIDPVVSAEANTVSDPNDPNSFYSQNYAQDFIDSNATASIYISPTPAKAPTQSANQLDISKE